MDLKSCVKKEMQLTREVILAFPWERAEEYALWLAQTYHMVNHSTRMVALAGALVGFDRNDLHARFVDHAREERNHQLACVSDLKAMGRKLEEFPCLETAAALYQIQYYWIEHRSPLSLFGYILSLECLATDFGPELYRRASAAHGQRAAKFLKVHVEDDIEHTEKAFQFVQAFPAREVELAQENLRLSAGLYRQMLRDVVEHATQSKRKFAA